MRHEKLITPETLADNLKSSWWRMNNLYKVINLQQEVVTFKPNEAQTMLLQNLHTRNLILKARRLGFSTGIQMLMLDTALFTPNFFATVIAQDQPKASAIMREKLKFAYDKLHPAIKELKPLQSDSLMQLEFPGDSVVKVTSSARSGMCNFLHVSEFGTIAAEEPGKAAEIISGSFPSVPDKGIICVESTAKGRTGQFKRMIDAALKLQEMGKPLGDRMFKLHFYGWFKMKEYRAPNGLIEITREQNDYFDRLEEKIGQRIDKEQRNWYCIQLEYEFLNDKETMWSEMPSTISEAFQVSLEGSIFQDQFKLLRKKQQITKVPYDPRYPVNTSWDLGAGDSTAIWCFQELRGAYHVIDYYENSGEPFEFYVRKLSELGYVWGKHFLPHDGNHRRQQGLKNQTPAEMIQESAPGWQIEIVNKTPDKQIAIQQARSFLPLCIFDETNCKKGIENLEAYRRTWNARTGSWSDKPYHGPESNGADAFLTAAQAKANGDFANYSYDQTNYEPQEEVW